MSAKESAERWPGDDEGAEIVRPESASEQRAGAALARWLADVRLEALLRGLHRLGVQHTFGAHPNNAKPGRTCHAAVFVHEGADTAPSRCYRARRSGTAGAKRALESAIAHMLVLEDHAWKKYRGPETPATHKDEEPRIVTALEHTLITVPLETTIASLDQLGLSWSARALSRSPHTHGRFKTMVAVHAHGKLPEGTARTRRRYEIARNHGTLAGALCDAAAAFFSAETTDHHGYGANANDIAKLPPGQLSDVV